LTAISDAPFIGRICERPDVGPADRGRDILLVRSTLEKLPEGFSAYLMQVDDRVQRDDRRNVFALAPEMHYLADGDVVRLDPRRCSLTALYRRNSPSNSFLMTERCDNYCVMCSQPPKERDDSWLLEELRTVVPLISKETVEIGITGGEPTLLGEGLVAFVEQLRDELPATALHILSNGRRFADAAFAKRLAAVRHPDLMLGIPLYSDVADEHDYVVQARGAFSETVRGILNLKQHRVRVELRFVIHADTYARLPEFAQFLARNLLFVDHVALMGLEPTGFAKSNLYALWIDPLEYGRQLSDAVRTLDRAGMSVSIYNHQLCVLDPALHQFARKSISDWKSMYVDECDGCAKRDDCGGFFASSTSHRSTGIRRLGWPETTPAGTD